MSSRTFLILLFAPLALLAPACLPAVSSAAVAPASAWQVTAVGAPTVLAPEDGKKGEYSAVVENVGGAASQGVTVVRDKLPAGLTAVLVESEPATGPSGEFSECEPEGEEIVCRFPESVAPSGFVIVNIKEFVVTGSLTPGSVLRNVISVSGGGAPEAGGVAETRVRAPGEAGPGPAGIAHFSVSATGPAGEEVSQAAGHPNLLTTSILFNNVFLQNINEPTIPVEAPKDLMFYLPLGMLGDPAVTNLCPATSVEIGNSRSDCPPGSRVGSILPMILNTVYANNAEDPTHVRPIYSIVPEKGYAAEFAFASTNIEFVLYASVVWHDGAYMIRASDPGIPAVGRLIGLVASFYGDVQEHYFSGEEPVTFDRGAFLTSPSDCGEGEAAREASIEVNTWEHPEALLSASSSVFPELKGCEELSFSSRLASGPDVRAVGDTTMADEPSGYTTELEVPQAPNNGGGLGTPPFKTVDFTFPQGTSLSPGAANGLTSCAASGPEGIDFPNGQGKPGIPGSETGEGEVDGADGLPRPVQGHCPPASIVGNVTATSPLLKDDLTGHLYLAEPECGNQAHPDACTPTDAEDGKLYRLYLELEDAQEGVIVKLSGTAHVDPGTGQITSVFEGAPQFPVGDLRIETTGGARAPLANPQECGTATTTGVVAPWDGGQASEPTGGFQVNEGCGPTGFSPVFLAQSTSPTAGAYSPFVLTLKREDREQDIGALSTTLPEGLLAAVSHVAECPEPQASEGGCPTASKVGTTNVAIGAGSGPYYQTGQVYFTGPYGGAPFGLSVVVPAVAGPFNLGDVIVRVALHIDPSTAQVTASTPPVGAPGGLPRIIDGVPLRVRSITVTLENPVFTFNPTNCAKTTISGTATGMLPDGTVGSTAVVSSPFAVAGCDGMPFKPALAISTSAHGSTRGDGESLTVKVTPPAQGPSDGSGGSSARSEEANIRSVKVSLPKQLPSRLGTLQKACPARQFDANPAGCPAQSVVGRASVKTPILAVPLEGPAYFVSNGGEEFPNLVLLLQGQGVLIELVGDTNIKHGITSSTFKAVPDAPFQGFELTLPKGPYSVLGATTNPCTTKLVAPSEFVAQNGAVLEQNTQVKVQGCNGKLSTKCCSRKFSIKSKKVGERSVTLGVFAPGAGKVTVSGAGVGSVSESYVGAATKTFMLKARQVGMRVRLKLVFKPNKGRRQTRTLQVKFK